MTKPADPLQPLIGSSLTEQMGDFQVMKTEIPPAQDTTEQPKITWTVQFVVNAIDEEEAQRITAVCPNAKLTSDGKGMVIKADQYKAEGIALQLKRLYPEADIVTPPHKPAVFIPSSD